MSKLEQNKTRDQIAKVYFKLAQKNQFHPNKTDLMKKGVSRSKIRHHFGTLEDVVEYIRKYFPKELDSVFDEELYSKKNLDKLQNTINSRKRFVITTAVLGCPVHKGFLKNIEAYCENRDAELLVLLSMDPATKGEKILDKELADKNIIFQDVALNDNLFLSTIKLSAKHIDPITSMGRIGQREGSFIYASPKQRLKMIATSNNKLPHAIMTSGAITKPFYKTSRYMSERTAYIAENDHVMGAIIVEIQDDKIFHFRQIQADHTGSIIDLGSMYKSGEASSMVAPAAIVWGDYHSGETDRVAEKTWLDLHRYTGCKTAVVHDGFNGKAINHHEEHNKILRAQLFSKNLLSLEAELRQYTVDLDHIASFLTDKVGEPGQPGKIIISKSNHDEFLERYLREGRYLEDPQNYNFASKLVTAMLDGHDPLKYALEKLIGLKHANKIVWLSRDQDYKIAKIEVGAHGDKGANGSRGNIQSMENAYGLSVSGHTHIPQILRGAWCVGTTSLLKLNYNIGPSGWMHTSCVIYSNGMRQLINSINGNWRA
jgi:hypothetical protein